VSFDCHRTSKETSIKLDQLPVQHQKLLSTDLMVTSDKNESIDLIRPQD
jgi:hypothetical protein